MFKWLARMFTIPASVRKQIDHNPIVLAYAPTIYNDVMAAVDVTLTKNITNPVLASALKSAIAFALEHAGIKPAS